MAQFTPTWKIVLVASIQAAVEFASKVKGALITPSAKNLGILDIFSMLLIWISGPLCEIVIPIIVGYCNKWLRKTKLGRNKPIIAMGCLVQIVGMTMISLTWDVGQVDISASMLPPTTFWKIRYMFVGGCWIMEISKSLIGCSVSSLMQDLCQEDQVRIIQSEQWIIVSSTLGSVAGSAASSYFHLYKVFPFTRTYYCDAACANLKSCYIINMLLLGVTICIAFKYISQPSALEQHETGEDEIQLSGLTQLKQAMRKPFLHLYLAYAFTMVAWYPFEVFGSDYVGKYVYGGEVGSTLYMEGVGVAALGLMLFSMVDGVVSLIFERFLKALGGLHRVWGMSAILLACSFVGSIVLQHKATQASSNGVALTHSPKRIRIVTLAFYGVLGIPNAASSRIPSLLASVYADSVANNPGGVKDISVALLKVFDLLSDVVAILLCLAFGSNYTMFKIAAIASVLSSIVIFTGLPSTNT